MDTRDIFPELSLMKEVGMGSQDQLVPLASLTQHQSKNSVQKLSGELCHPEQKPRAREQHRSLNCLHFKD